MGQRRSAWMVAGILLGSVSAAGAQVAPAQPPLRWSADALGNHRYLLQVNAPATAVHVVIPWRRRDAHPEQVAVIVVGPQGQPVANVLRASIDRAQGELVFEAKQAGTYAVYYQPYLSKGRSNYPTVTYQPPTYSADAAWTHKVGTGASAWRALPQAQVLRYEAVDDFDAYTEMERTATPQELQALLAAHAHDALLLFPETRAYPTRMFDALPARWAQRGPGGGLADQVKGGEYLSFQVGAWAPRGKVENVQLHVGDLVSEGGARIPAGAFTCFNLGGVDFTGKPFTARVDVAAGRVQPLWVGLDVPSTAMPGVYRGELTVSADGVSAQTVPLTITVGEEKAIAHGDNDPFQLTRLRWLNSTLAQDDTLVKPFTAITVRGDALGILGRELRLDSTGLPSQITSRFNERMTGFSQTPKAMLAAPMRLIVQDEQGDHALTAQGIPGIQRDGDAKVHWHVAGQAGPLQGDVQASLEADGSLVYAIALTAAQAIRLRDIRLELPLRKEVAQYQLGLGRQGDDVPADFQWKWNVENNQDGAWIGTVNAGLEFHLRDEHYQRPLNTNFYHQQPLRLPVSWDNGGQGGIRLHRAQGDYAVQAFSGPRQMQAGETLRYDIVMRVTPFKTIDPAKHFSERFFHKYGELDSIKADDANVVNIHHATPINPWINYPFLEADAMRAYIDAAHQRGMRVKIYDTVRELSDRAPELPMLESLGHEVISSGKGGGFSWLQEHMDGDYIAAWHVPENRDAAVINAGQSRWHNYYIEGLDWLARNVGIDGLYLDDVAYDRTTMKRVRKVLQAHRPDPLIDLHSASQYNPRDGYINSALLYMELFPYIDRLWFGEEFDYEKTSPRYWLTEISGIPYGLMGEMLQNDGNPWRGMLFGMTNRLGWSAGSDPRGLWALWDAFGIEQADMVGWWVHDTPIKTDRDDVLVTSYVRKGKKTLIALASWAPQPVQVKLAIDWKALGLTPGKATLSASAVEGFQPAAQFKVGDSIPVQPGKGWLIVVE
ncbi:glycoside hydrolase domain-containing protein [Dyella sp. ASV21]|uniref:glycoside hydrolase domain-containing protein n=1 Tax=Dyella sp. ASV21 TaxID=2795114 RepID=UPI0018EAC27F|nr:glycoside hydrolase domain-containing protein [Dyella sp. ASV21]